MTAVADPRVRVSGIYTYPLKAARGIQNGSAQVERRGLHGDRRWMLVDETGRFISQRSHPMLALVTVTPAGEGLTVSAPRMVPLSVPIPGSTSPIAVQIWNDTVDALPASEEAAGWFSRYLAVACRLVYMPDSTERQVDLRFGTPDDIVSFADGYPILLISQASLDALNQRLDTPVTMERFRPSVVVAGCTPHEEDRWLRIRIGAVEFRIVKPCARCTVPRIDPETGIPQKEPLRTLAEYRKKGSKVYFGQNSIPDGSGEIAIGDPVVVLEERSDKL